MSKKMGYPSTNNSFEDYLTFGDDKEKRDYV